MNLLYLAWQLLKRDWHAGELRVLIAALIIAVASISSIGIFTQRINLAMLDQSGRFLGADLLLSAPRPHERPAGAGGLRRRPGRQPGRGALASP